MSWVGGYADPNYEHLEVLAEKAQGYGATAEDIRRYVAALNKLARTRARVDPQPKPARAQPKSPRLTHPKANVWTIRDDRQRAA